MSRKIIAYRLLSHTTVLSIGIYIGKSFLRQPKPINTQENEMSSTYEQFYSYLEKSDLDKKQWPKYNINVENVVNVNDSLSLFKKFNEFGLPPNLGQINVFSNFLCVTDTRIRIPLYVAWTIPHIDHYNFKAKSDRKYSKFKRSDSFYNFTSFNPDNSDYLNSNYSRGHLANCGDFTAFEQTSMDETHLLAMNIVPQNYENNAGYWLLMERYTRELAERFDFVHVIAGPAFVPDIFPQENNEIEKEKRKQIGPKGVVRYHIIGENNVAVPTHLFRIIIAQKEINTNEDTQIKYFVQAFLVPNTKINPTDHLTKYCVSFKDLEKFTGLKFLHKLDHENKILPLCCQNKTGNETSEINKSTSCASNCNLPPWQDLIFQQTLWKKNVTKEEVEDKWNKLIDETKWKPSRDIIRRKNEFLKKLNQNVPKK